MSKITTNDTIARTFFVVINEKSLKNMLITPDWENIEQFENVLISSLSDILGHDNFYGTICKSAKGLYHIHLVETENKATRFSTVAKKLGNSHIEPMRGTKEQAEAYIEKKGAFEEKGEVILGYFGNRDSIQNNSGKRNDLDIEHMIRKGELNATNLTRYILDNSNTDTEAKRIENRYTRIMHDIYDHKERPNIKVIYVEGKTGSGKTRGALERYPDIFQASVDEKNNFAFDNYHGEKCLLLDELRPGVFNVGFLLKLLDKHPFLFNVKYGNFPACYDTVIIATAFPLNKWFADENIEGNDDRQAQFRRRINEYYIAENGKWIDQHYTWNDNEKVATCDAWTTDKWQQADDTILNVFDKS